MSNQSGAEGVISLPKGGGALQGIGEKFSPDLHTGTGNFAVPISLPPGRGGFQPELSLVYSTGNGNGLFGLGWSLSIPGITRKTSKGVPRYGPDDVFILSGAEDLVPLGNTNGYRPRTEGLFARIERHRDAAAGDDYWEVHSKDGLVSVYGTSGAAGDDPATVADGSRIFSWSLARTTDPFGNLIEYEYLPRPDADQLYPARIRYADYNAESGETKFLVLVTFEYEDRPDPFSEYRAGFEIRTHKRCTKIKIQTHAGEGRPVRTYDLVYLDERDDVEQPLPPNGVSLLSQVRVLGYDDAGDPVNELPPLEFGYTRFEPVGREFVALQGANLPARSLANPELELADLSGDGLPDILEMNGSVRYWHNLGDGRYDLPREMRTAPAGINLSDSGVQLIDANGDGRTDLLVANGGSSSGYYPLRSGGQWDRRSFQRYTKAPSFDLEDPEVRLVDLDGDGVTDVVRSGTSFECFFNDPKEGWNGTRRLKRRALEEFPNVNFSDPRVKWADITGDGLQDIVLVYDGNVEYWPNMGHGDWGSRVSMRNSPSFPYGYDPRRILVGDVDGDGAADIVYVDDTRVTVWINRSGNGWSDPMVIRGTPSVSDVDAVRLIDVFGTGIGGVLWSADAGARSRESMFFLDFTGGTKPFLLDEMDNRMGSVTRVGYAPSTRFFLEDQKRPETRWRTPLPFPVQVVSRVESIDEISKGKLTTEYRYHHGYWDGAEREFRGFGMVEQLDTETFEVYNGPGLHSEEAPSVTVEDPTSFSPPTLTKTWFHQGPVDEGFAEWREPDGFVDEFWQGDPQILPALLSGADPLEGLQGRARRDALRTFRGRTIRTELYALDGTEREGLPYTVTEYLHGVREESPPGPGETDRPRIFFPYDLAQRTTQWERGNDLMTQFGFTEDYDEYGQPRRQTRIACPRGWRGTEDTPGNPYLATRSQTVYARPDDPDVYIADRVAKTTTYEIENDGTGRVSVLKDTPEASRSLEVIGQTLNFYDGAAFQGLPYGRLGKYGALVRTENLVLTKDILHEAYRSGGAVLDPAEEPPYLATGGSPDWSGYPQEFRDRLPSLAGYTYRPGGAEYEEGYFAAGDRRRYDFHDDPGGEGRGMVVVERDPLGRDVEITYDAAYGLLPVEVTAPIGLKAIATYNYRVLQINEATDCNGNRTRFAFTPLGLLKETWVLGKSTSEEGDRQRPSVRLMYDFRAFVERGEPVHVRATRQVHHDTETEVPLPQRDETVTTVEYSDGFGRLLQTRTQAEDIIFGDPTSGDQVLPASQSEPGGDAVGRPIAATEPRVVVSGWQIYDNKGRVVEKYEPLFAEGWAYTPPTVAQLGQRVMMFYDPRGQVVRTVNPDGSEQRMVYGVPADLSRPDTFAPTPWETYAYDANDNSGRTHPVASMGYENHRNTPTSSVVDALGRTVETVERNGPDPATDRYTTSSVYDVRGNLISATDPLKRRASRHVYDLANRALRTEQLDAGLRRMVLDAAGNVVEQHDAKGALMLRVFDAANRPTHLWARDGAGQALTLRERIIYGDSQDSGLSAEQAVAANLLGKPYKHHDEAGSLAFEAYDFKGNMLEKARRVIGDGEILSVFKPAPPNWQVKAFRVNWQPPSGTTLEAYASKLLDPTVYRTSLSYDALNRLKSMRYPQDVAGARKELRPHYNWAGALEHVEMDGTTYVERIAYNARGQRTLIAYGNGVMTRHAYDLQTFRLARMRTERYTKPNALTYRPAAAPLQDLGYGYDLAGNLLELRDRTPGSGVAAKPNSLDRAFNYDPLYRLLSATGRECDVPQPAPWNPGPRCVDVTKTRAYTQTYQYDPAGNLGRLQHTATGGSFTRALALAPNANRLATMTVGSTSYAYAYDPGGNLVRETSSRHFEWDHSDRMRVYRTQVGDSEPTVHVHYLYDASGQRVKKLVRKSGQTEVTVYIEGIFEHQRVIKAGGVQENNSLHVMDNQNRISVVRVGAPFPNDATPAVTYHLGDHLGSSNLVIDAAGSWTNREEYTPYGETSFGGFARKRYRFTGKERDEESGLYYHGARYYAPWLGRWVSCDPGGMVDGLNLYAYARNNPMGLVDPTGTQSEGGINDAAITSATEATVSVTGNETHIDFYHEGSGSDPASDSGGGGEHTDAPPEGQLEEAPSAEETPSAEEAPGPKDSGTSADTGELPDPGTSGSWMTAAGLLASRAGSSAGKMTSILWTGKNALEGALEMGTKASGAFRSLESSALGKISYALSNPVLKITGKAQWAKTALYHALWKPVSAIYGFHAGISGHKVLKLIQTNLPIDPKYGFGSILRNIESPMFRWGQKAIAPVKALGRKLPVIGGVLSAVGLAHDIQTGNVSEGVGNALGVAAAAAALLGAGSAAAVLSAAAIGYSIGSLINEYAAQPLIDKAAPGSGAVGDWYYRTFLK
jgi:RHS repeat-associated protein